MVDGRQNSVVSKDGIRSFQDLEVWQYSRRLTLDIYKTTKSFPKEEAYGLTSQFRRAAVSVSANIAEGFSRRSNPDKYHFYNMAQASLQELKCYLILCEDLGYLDSKAATWEISERVGKMLFRLMETVRNV
jgi:four helix bundle protein